jgi:hypothetical protein
LHDRLEYMNMLKIPHISSVRSMPSTVDTPCKQQKRMKMSSDQKKNPTIPSSLETM